MSIRNYKSKRHRIHKFVGLLIVLMLSIGALFWFVTKPFDNFLSVAKATPTLQLSNDNNHSINNDNLVDGVPSAVGNADTADDTGNNRIDNNNIDSSTLNQELILVNRQNPIPDNYKVELVELSNGQSVDNRIYPALQKMFDAARANGVYPVIASGYRTTKQQQALMDDKISAYINDGLSSEKAIAKAKEWVAIPGTSEHQLGLAIDINADGVNSSGDDVYDWLAKNAHTYGFICRYPEDKTNITGIIYEPWHYRYVGTVAAAEMYQQGVCLEEYLNAMD